MSKNCTEVFDQGLLIVDECTARTSEKVFSLRENPISPVSHTLCFFNTGSRLFARLPWDSHFAPRREALRVLSIWFITGKEQSPA